MRLREIGPGIGGLYYEPLLRQRNERAMRRVLARLPEDQAGPTPAQRWHSLCATARAVVERIASLRKSQAALRTEIDAALLARSGGQRPGHTIEGLPGY